MYEECNKLDCYYLHPTNPKLTTGNGYRCHCDTCPAFCDNCIHNNNCKNHNNENWCENFKLDENINLTKQQTTKPDSINHGINFLCEQIKCENDKYIIQSLKNKYKGNQL
jgi:hypothetical protein